jgi:hypothetical protein
MNPTIPRFPFDAAVAGLRLGGHVADLDAMKDCAFDLIRSGA